MNEKLETLLEKIEDTPLQEKEIYEAIEKNHPKKSKAIKIALGRDSLKMNDFSAIEIAEFYSKMHDKILSYKDKDGYFKKTKNTENINLPSFEETEEITDLVQKIGNKLSHKDASKTIKLSEKLEKMIFDIAGVNKDDLTEWEAGLVTSQITACSIDASMTALGKELKN